MPKAYVLEIEFSDRQDAEKVLEVIINTVPFDGEAQLTVRESVAQPC